MNETTKNFLKALNEFVTEPIDPISIKLTYDPDTFYVTGCTSGDTDQPYVEITHEQWRKGFHYQKLKIVDGKPTVVERIRKKELALMHGNRWHTDRSNMLIIGTDKGWDERTNS